MMGLPSLIKQLLEDSLNAAEKVGLEFVACGGPGIHRECYWTSVDRLMGGNWGVTSEKRVAANFLGFGCLWLRLDDDTEMEFGAEGIGFVFEEPGRGRILFDEAQRWIRRNFTLPGTSLEAAQISGADLLSELPEVRTVLIPALAALKSGWGFQFRGFPVRELYDAITAGVEGITIFRRSKPQQPAAEGVGPHDFFDRILWTTAALGRTLNQPGMVELCLLSGLSAVKASRSEDGVWSISELRAGTDDLGGMVWLRLVPDHAWNTVVTKGTGFMWQPVFPGIVRSGFHSVSPSAEIDEGAYTILRPIADLCEALARTGPKKPGGLPLPPRVRAALCAVKYACGLRRKLTLWFLEKA